MKSFKEIKDIMKYFKKNNNSKDKETARKLYAQALSSSNNTREVLKIKEVFLNFQSNKIENIQKIINGGNKPKPYLNMTTKGPSHKQVIVPIDSNNMVKFIFSSSNYIININRLLKNIKSEYKTNYIRVEKSGIIIVTNKVMSPLDLQTIEKYVKNSNQIDVNKIEFSWLPQSKSYLKIISLLYFIDNTNISIKADMIEKILKNNHVFNNILLASQPRIIKVFPKLDIAII